uniref:Ig-like domain-containing protein n=1 Tax=Myripristis murdjan TaxID=586833 RepID=A0A667WYF1_9TELE
MVVYSFNYTLSFFKFTVASGDSVKAISGFHGEAVTLDSGANPSWNISTIEWSILSNNTFIATYRSGQTSINRFWRYKDRLSLNTATGDLTIRNLSEEDAIEYNLYLIYRNTQKLRSKTKLTVARRIQKPHLRKLFSGLVEETCMIVMDCSSEGKAIEFSWQAQPYSSMRQSVGKNSSVLVLSVQDEVNVTCTVRNGVENASAVDTVRCSECVVCVCLVLLSLGLLWASAFGQ